MASQINFEIGNRPEALVCMQEVLNGQLVDLQSDLGSTWNHVGVSRKDGAQDGEYSLILYQTDTWQLERNKTYWLSETPTWLVLPDGMLPCRASSLLPSSSIAQQESHWFSCARTLTILAPLPGTRAQS